jgi:hypothetical protein
MGRRMVDKGRKMMGFAVSTAAVFLAAWLGFVAGRAGRPRVPAGTCATPCHPADCDDSCPRYPEVQRLARAHVDRDDRIYGRNG